MRAFYPISAILAAGIEPAAKMLIHPHRKRMGLSERISKLGGSAKHALHASPSRVGHSPHP